MEQVTADSASENSIRKFSFIVKLLATAYEAQASEIQIEQRAEFIHIRFILTRVENGEDKKYLLREVKFDPEFYLGVYARLLNQSFYWPDLSPSSLFKAQRQRRIFLSPPNGLKIMADLSAEQTEEGHVVCLNNITHGNICGVLDLVGSSEQTKDILKRSASLTSGLILTARGATRHSIDAGAVMLALRPEAIFFPNISSVDEARYALNKAKEQLVIAEVDAVDAVQALFEYLVMLHSSSSRIPGDISVLKLAFAHRRASRVCQKCLVTTEIKPEAISKIPQIFHQELGMTNNTGAGCVDCGNSGYNGTIGINSLVELSENIRRQLITGALQPEVTLTAYKGGTRSLYEDGLRNVKLGYTNLEAILPTVPAISPGFLEAIKICASYQKAEKDSKLELDLRSVGDTFFAQQNIEETVSDEESVNLPNIVIKEDTEGVTAEAETDSVKILVVEDDIKQRKIIEMVLQAAGYSVFLVQHGKAALELLSNTIVDLVISDVRMPVMNGEAFVKELRESSPQAGVPVLMLTTENDLELQSRLRAYGIEDYCDKTIRRPQLLQKIEDIIARTKSNPLSHFLTD